MIFCYLIDLIFASELRQALRYLFVFLSILNFNKARYKQLIEIIGFRQLPKAIIRKLVAAAFLIVMMILHNDLISTSTSFLLLLYIVLNVTAHLTAQSISGSMRFKLPE